MSELNKTIIVAGIMFSFVVNSIMFSWEATRRPAEDLVKMNTEISDDRLSKVCVDEGGKAVFNDFNQYLRCDYNK